MTDLKPDVFVFLELDAFIKNGVFDENWSFSLVDSGLIQHVSLPI